MEGGDDHEVRLVAAADGASGGPAAPEPIARPAPQAPPTPLPVLHMNDVPLKDLAGRLIRAADFKFQELLKTLPSAAGPDRQRQLLQYAQSQREDFEKLLVLTRFGRKARDWQQVMNVHGLIDRQTECMARAGHDLRAMVAQLRARVETSAPDVLGALDILSNKTYTQLPRILKDALPAKPPARSETKAILHELDKLIRRRIELEIIPDAMRANMVIEKGCVTFRVENRFQLALTLVGHDFSLPWRIVELEFFVQSADSYKGLFSGLLGHQKFAILQQAQVLIEQVQKRDPRGPRFTERATANAEQSAPASPVVISLSKKDLPTPSHGDAKRQTLSDGAATETGAGPTRTKPKKRKTGVPPPSDGLDGKKAINGKVPKSVTAKEKGKKKGFKKEKESVATNGFAPPVPVAAAPDTPKTPAPDPPPPLKPEPPKLHNPYPILYVYEYLHKLLLRVQLQILTAQAHSLARDRWHKLLKVEELRESETVRLTYWSHPIPRPDPRTVPAGFQVPNRYCVMELAIKTDPPAKNRAFDRWEARRSKGRGYLTHLSKDLVAANLFGDAVRPHTRFDIRCYSVVPDLAGGRTLEPLVNPETRAPIPLALNPSRLDLGALLTNVTDLQARFVLHRVRNLLVGAEPNRGLSAVQLLSRVTGAFEEARNVKNDVDPPRQATFRWERNREIRDTEKPASPPSLSEAKPSGDVATGSSSQSFRARDVQLHEWAPSGDSTEAMQCELAVTLHKDVLASAKVDTWTGRVLLTPPGGAVRGSGFTQTPLQSVLEQRLNDHPGDAAEIFLYLRYSSFMERISTWCEQLGLKASIVSPLKNGEETRATGFPIQHKIFVRVAGFKEAWILIAVAGSEDWDAAAGGGGRAGSPSLATTSAAHAGAAEFRIWLVETTFEGQSVRRFGRARREMNREIIRATPIRVRDVFALDAAGRYRDARKVDDMIPWRPPEPATGWDHLDAITLAAIERMCRLQHAHNRVAAGLEALRIQYCYLSPDGNTAVYADEAAPADRARLAGTIPRICVPEEDLAVAMGKLALVNNQDDRNGSLRTAQLPFGNLYVSVERHQLPGHDTGDGSFASADLGVGRPTEVQGIRIRGVCPVKLGIAHGLLVQHDVATDRWIYRSDMEAVTFTFDGGGRLDRCSNIMIDELVAIGAIAELAQQVASHRTRLAKIGVTVDPFDLQSLSLTYNHTLRLRVWAVATGQVADGVVKNGPQHSYCAEMTCTEPPASVSQPANGKPYRHQIPPEMVARIQSFWVQTLNETRDLPQAFLVLWHLAPLLRLVHALERKRNTAVVGGENIFVTVKFHSLTHVQLVYGAQHGVELAMLPTGHFAFYDSTLLPGRQRMGGGVAGGGLPGNLHARPQPPDPAAGLGPIPLFNGLIKGIGRAAMGPEFPVGTSAMPVSFGVSFHPAMLDYVVTKMDTHLNNVSLLLWIESEAGKRLPIPQNSHKNTHVDLPNMRATINTDARSVMLKVSATNSWEVGLAPRAPENAVTDELLNILADLVAEKINNLPSGTDLRPFLLFFLDFLTMPTKVVTNLLCIARDERRFANVPEEGVVAEWCFAVPPGAPAYIGPPNAPGTEFDPTLNRISIIFRVTNLQTSRSLLVPLRYNYQTDVIGRWQGNNADDFTGVQEMNPFMLETMQRAYLSDTFTGLMAKVMMNYTDEILRISKLATLIRIAVKRCKTAPAGLDWVLG